jgi:zinc protease
VSVFQSGSGMSGQFHVVVDLRTEADLGEVERIVGEALAALAATPPDERELARAVTRREAAFIWRLESLTARASTLHIYNHHVGDPGYASQDLDRYRGATPEGVRDVVRAWLRPEARVEVITMPAPAGAP